MHPYALLLITTFIGATVRAIRNQKIDPWIGLRTGVSSIAFAWGFVAGVCDACDFDIALWIAILGGGLAFLGNEGLTAFEKHGTRVLNEPWLLVADWMPPALKKILTQIK